MPGTFDKLNLSGQAEIVVLGAPASFEHELESLEDVVVIRNVANAKAINFALSFVTQRAEVEKLARILTRKAEGDALLWFAYPKGSSKRLRSELSRDRGWEPLLSAGFDTVRLIAIDDDWSALRFRRTEYIGGKKPAAR